MSLENESSVLQTSVSDAAVSDTVADSIVSVPVDGNADNVVIDENQEPPSTPSLVTEQVSLPSELCTLCMDTRNDPVTLTCSEHHTFCRKCLLQTGPPHCPMCRAPYKYTDLWNDELYDPENEFHVQFKRALDNFGRAIVHVTEAREIQERTRYAEELTRQRLLQNPLFENTLQRRLDFLASVVARQPIHIIRAFADRLGVPVHEDDDWEQLHALREYLGSEDTAIPTDVYQDAAYELVTHPERNAHVGLPPMNPSIASLQTQLQTAFPGARITRVTPEQFHTVGGNPMPGLSGFSVTGTTFYNYEGSDDDENNNQDENEENQIPISQPPPSDPYPTFVPDVRNHRNHTFIHTSPNLPDPTLLLPRMNVVNDVRMEPVPQAASRLTRFWQWLRNGSEFESENGAKFIIWLVLTIVSVFSPWTFAIQQSMDDRNRSITYLLAYTIHEIVAVANTLVVATYISFLNQYYTVGILFGVLWLAINYLHTISIRTLVAFQRHYRGNEYFNTGTTNCIAKVKYYFSRI